MLSARPLPKSKVEILYHFVNCSERLLNEDKGFGETRFSNLFDCSITQVQAAPKKRPDKTKESTEAVQPKTLREQVSSKLQDWLKSAATCRTSSITLASLEFADELAKKMKVQAIDMEKTYTNIAASVKDKKTKDREFQELLETMNEKMKSCEKLQASELLQLVDLLAHMLKQIEVSYRPSKIISLYRP